MHPSATAWTSQVFPSILCHPIQETTSSKVITSDPSWEPQDAEAMVCSSIRVLSYRDNALALWIPNPRASLHGPRLVLTQSDHWVKRMWKGLLLEYSPGDTDIFPDWNSLKLQKGTQEFQVPCKRGCVGVHFPILFKGTK